MTFNFEQPKSDSIAYNKLINDTESGLIKIPKFQRDFVWSIEDTAKLLDSILKGYPIGSFILWETAERMSSIKNLGNLNLPLPPEGQKISYVLDGQQRIASLFVAYRGAKIRKEGERKETDYGSIVVNLDADVANDEQIVTVAPTGDAYISLSDVLNFSYTKGVEIEKKFDKEKAQLADQYAHAFRDYVFSIVILKKEDISSAIEVFTRINTGGKKLTLFEIMSAKTYDEEQNFDMQKKWQDFVEDLEDVDYDSISSSIVLNLLALTLSPAKECQRHVTLSLDKQKIIDHWDKTLSALRDSVDYCRQHLFIPVSQLLPYDAMLVPFAYFFYYQKPDKMSRRQDKQLKDLFWRTALSYRYSGASETRLAQDIRNVVERILSGDPENLPKYDYRVPAIDLQDLTEREFKSGDSFCKAVLCLLASHDPKGFYDGSKVNLSNAYMKQSNSKNYHHFFPRAFLKRKGFSNPNSLMNITLISDLDNKKRIKDKAPSSYIGNFEQGNTQTVKEALETHFISRDGSGIDEDDYNAFLQARADRICKALRAKVDEAGGE